MHVNKSYHQPLQYLVDFRQYIYYHIHAIKTFLHVRMRDKVNKLSNSLSYAYIDGEKGGKKYKD